MTTTILATPTKTIIIRPRCGSILFFHIEEARYNEIKHELPETSSPVLIDRNCRRPVSLSFSSDVFPQVFKAFDLVGKSCKAIAEEMDPDELHLILRNWLWELQDKDSLPFPDNNRNHLFPDSVAATNDYVNIFHYDMYPVEEEGVITSDGCIRLTLPIDYCGLTYSY